MPDLDSHRSSSTDMPDVQRMSEFRALFGKNKVRSTSREYYEWKILRNPFQRGSIYLERKDGIVAGSTTLTPKKLFVQGLGVQAAEIGDTFTHPEYRRQGIFSRGVRACTQYAVSHGIEVIYGTPNTQSLPGYQSKLGYPPCPFISLSYMTKNRRHLRALVRSLAKLTLGRRLGPPDVSPSVILRQAFSNRAASGPRVARGAEPFDIAAVDAFVDDIDGLWGKPRYIFCTIRDKTYLNWRYFDHPDDYHVVVAKEAGRLLGYVVTKVSNDGRIGTICDFITFDDRLDVFHALIDEAEKSLEKAGVHLIQLRCAAGSPYHEALLERGYYDHGSLGRQQVIVYSGSDHGRTLLATRAPWHFTLSDSDNI